MSAASFSRVAAAGTRSPAGFSVRRPRLAPGLGNCSPQAKSYRFPPFRGSARRAPLRGPSRVDGFCRSIRRAPFGATSIPEENLGAERDPDTG